MLELRDKEETVEQQVEETVEQQVEETVEQQVEDTVEETVEQQVEDTVEETVEQQETKGQCTGVVVVDTLNVRAQPIAVDTSKVKEVVVRGAVLLINEALSSAEWYNVKTESGIIGYCMKKFVEIQ